MKHKRYTLFAASLLVFTGLNLPVKCFGQVRAGAAYLKILPGTRQQGVSGSMTAGLDESFSIYSNPGATGLLREWQFAMSYTKWIAEINNTSLFAGKRFGFSTPFGRNLYAGFGLNSQWVDVQSTNGLVPSASARDVLLTGTLGIPLDKILENLSLGTNIKYLNSDLDVSSVSSLLFDVGLIYRTQRIKFPLLPFEGIFSFGGSINHFGKSLKFQNLDTPLPKVYRLGAGLNLGTHNGLQFQLVGDFRRVRDESDQYGIGLEVMNILNVIPVMNKMGGRFLSARFGWLESNGQDQNILDKLSFGFSLNFDDFMNNRAKSGNGGFAAANTSWRFDMTNQSNVSVAGDVSHFGGALFPNGPEAFEFVLDEKFMTTDTSDVYPYELGGDVELAWQASRDPDLYDNANYVILVAKDRPVLKEMLESSFFEIPQGPVNTVLYHPAARGKGKPAQLYGDYVEKNENHISYATTRSIDSSEVELFYFFPHQIKAENLVDLSNFVGSNPVLKSDSTFTFSKKENQFKYAYHPTFDNCNYSGDYYWSVIAYDKNFHQRVVSSKKDNIAHFKVVGRPDLTININRIDSVSSTLPETFSLEDVHFAFGKADTSDLYPASKDSLRKWVQRFNQASYDSILVYGYTDSTGSEAINQKLSRERAESVLTYLKRGGVSSINYAALGFGERKLLDQMLSESRTAWSRRNRRVRMRVVKRPPPKQYFARLDITNEGQVESPAGFSLNVFDQTDNFVEKSPQVTLGVPSVLMTPFELDIVDGLDAEFASRIPGYIDARLNVHPDSTNFRFDKFDNVQMLPDTIFKVENISCGETVSFITTWNEQNRFLVAIVDQIDEVEEINEHNNWDIEQLLATDLEISKKITRIKPLRIGANFEPNGDFLSKEGQRKLLKNPLDELKLAFDKLEFQNTYLEIGGHTDEIGSDVYNNALSFRRAKWIKNFLVNEFNFQPDRISAIGYGESNPLHDDVSLKYNYLSQEWLAKHEDNRRIELRWLQSTTGIVPKDTICNSCTSNDPTVRAAFVGQEIEYEIVISNLSKNDADGVKVIDILSEYFKLEKASVKSSAKTSFNVNSSADSLTWYLDIAGGASVSLNYNVELDKSFVNLMQPLENKAHVISKQDYNPQNNSAATSIFGIGNILPDVVKTHKVQCGESLSTIAAMYYGNVSDYKKIQSANGMGKSEIIRPEDKLKIPKANVVAQSLPGSMEIVTYGTLKVGSEIGGYLIPKASDRAVPAGNLTYRWLRDTVEAAKCAAYKIKPGDKKLTLEIIDQTTGVVFRRIIEVPVLPLPATGNKPSVVTIKGGCVVGKTLTATLDIDLQGDENKFVYGWLRDSILIRSGKGMTEYEIVDADKNALIMVEVTPSLGNTAGYSLKSNSIFIPKFKLYTKSCEEYVKPVSISQN